jgi:hypothetical protein
MVMKMPPRDPTDTPTTAEAIDSVARALRSLGTADAATPMGAIEYLTSTQEEGMESISRALVDISDSLDKVATAVEDGFADLAKAVRQTAGRD